MLRREARIVLPSTSIKTGLVCDEGRMRMATQLLRSIGMSKERSLILPSAVSSFFATG